MIQVHAQQCINHLSFKCIEQNSSMTGPRSLASPEFSILVDVSIAWVLYKYAAVILINTVQSQGHNVAL